MSAPRNISFVIAEPEEGRRLDRVIAERVPELSRARGQALIKEGSVTIAGDPARASRRVAAGQRVQILIPPPQETALVAEALPLEIIHEDDDIVVVNKAPGMVVHPAPGHPTGTLVNALLGRYGAALSVGGAVRPGIVHRLDKGTSGVMIVARHDAALVRLQRQFKRRTVRKTYVAVVHGHPPLEGRIETPYGRHPRHRQRFTSRAASAPRRAALSYRVERSLAESAVVEVVLETGRTHQIRVQFADAGFPLIGDSTYGRRTGGPAFPRPALHALRLECDHPGTGERLSWCAPVPADIRGLIGALGGDDA